MRDKICFRITRFFFTSSSPTLPSFALAGWCAGVYNNLAFTITCSTKQVSPPKYWTCTVRPLRVPFLQSRCGFSQISCLDSRAGERPACHRAGRRGCQSLFSMPETPAPGAPARCPRQAGLFSPSAVCHVGGEPGQRQVTCARAHPPLPYPAMCSPPGPGRPTNLPSHTRFTWEGN